MINPTLFNNIVNLLTPHMVEGERDTLIMPAFSGYPQIYGKIEKSGAAGPFTVRLIRLLDIYGEIEPGHSALFHLLEAVRPHVGLDVQRDIDGLLRELKAEKSNGQTGKGRPLRVFLCHGSSDKVEVRNLYKRLQRDGMDPWLDEEKLMPGQQWQQEISRAVRQSDVVVVALSHNAVNGEGYIRDEIRFALEAASELSDETIYIIPLKLEECDVPEQLAQWQWVDLFDARGYERLIKALQIRAQEINAQPPIWNSGEYRYVTKYKQTRSFHLSWLISGIIAMILVILAVVYYPSNFLTATPTFNLTLPTTVVPTVLPSPTPTATSTDVLTNTPLPTATGTPTVTPTFTPVVPTATPTLGIGSTYVNPIDGATYRYVPTGEFIMGSEDGKDDEKPQHTVYLGSYWIMETEVTNAQYRKFMEADGYTTEDYWSAEGWSRRGEITQPGCWDDNDLNGDEQPVVCVDWHEAQAYGKWLSTETGLDIGLPTEAQWEKAARGTDGRVYPWGNEWDGSKVNSSETDDGYQYTAPVGSYLAGASLYGALDMAGNVWEWTSDWHDSNYYNNSHSENPTGPKNGTNRVLRGGSWHNNPDFMRTTFRIRFNPNYRYYDVGFRLRLVAR